VTATHIAIRSLDAASWTLIVDQKGDLPTASLDLQAPYAAAPVKPQEGQAAAERRGCFP
jgi:hypothetical protein